LTALALGVALMAGVGTSVHDDADTRAGAGWGAEAVSALAEGASRVSPIPLANACGLGASSCFKCHNGTRAKAADMDPKKSPWHAQHAKVNNSCAGCHKGNPRIMKEDIAHSKMVARPRDDTAGSCAGCHASDLSKVQGAYAATAGAK
jgi:nitrate/TMAO reductase-like tetraheme cytochrome c subunit